MNDLHIVAESTDRANRIARDMPEYLSKRTLLAHEIPLAPPDGHVVVDVDLDKGFHFANLKAWLKRRPRGRQVIFAVDRGNRYQTVQAYALGATSVAPRPIDRKAILDALLGATAALLDDDLAVDTGSTAVFVGVRALQRVFASVVAGARLDIDQVEIAGASIVSQIASTGLRQWIETVRMHHSQTYQHCLLTTGVAAAFARGLGFSAVDQQRLALAGLLHDLGKGRIPIEVLEKSGPLDAAETELMRQHPLLGFEVLRKLKDLDPQMAEVVIQHHERLDGSGYPYGLRGREIFDLTRVVTVADVFSALIEQRPYKPALPFATAYRELVAMGPKLDVDLVREFGRIIAASLADEAVATGLSL